MKNHLLIIALFVSIFLNAQAPEVDYVAYGKYTTAQKLAIDVSDTSKTYFVFDDDLKKFQINYGLGWQDASGSTSITTFTVADETTNQLLYTPEGTIKLGAANGDVNRVLFDDTFSNYLQGYVDLVGVNDMYLVFHNKTQEKTLTGKIIGFNYATGLNTYYQASLSPAMDADAIAIGDEVDVYINLADIGVNSPNIVKLDVGNQFSGVPNLGTYDPYAGILVESNGNKNVIALGNLKIWMGGSDNLGNHTATQSLNMSDHDIINVDNLRVIGGDAFFANGVEVLGTIVGAGGINMISNKITNIGNATNPTDAPNWQQVQSYVDANYSSGFDPSANQTITGEWDFDTDVLISNSGNITTITPTGIASSSLTGNDKITINQTGIEVENTSASTTTNLDFETTTKNAVITFRNETGFVATEAYVDANSSSPLTAGKLGSGTPVEVNQLLFQGEGITFSEENGTGVVSVNSATPNFNNDTIPGDYTITAADNGKILKYDSTEDATITIPTSSTLNSTGGFNVTIRTVGTGKAQIVYADGVTGDVVESDLSEPYRNMFTIIEESTDVFYAQGSCVAYTPVVVVPNIYAETNALSGTNNSNSVTNLTSASSDDIAAIDLGGGIYEARVTYNSGGGTARFEFTFPVENGVSYELQMSGFTSDGGTGFGAGTNITFDSALNINGVDTTYNRVITATATGTATIQFSRFTRTLNEYMQFGNLIITQQ